MSSAHLLSFLLAVGLHFLLILVPSQNTAPALEPKHISPKTIAVRLAQMVPNSADSPSNAATALPKKLPVPPPPKPVQESPVHEAPKPAPFPKTSESPDIAASSPPLTLSDIPAAQKPPEASVRPSRQKSPERVLPKAMPPQAALTKENAPSSFSIPPKKTKGHLPAETNSGIPDKNIRIESVSPPVYPFSARRQQREGSVQLKIWVLEDGKIGDVEIFQSSGWDDFDTAAIQAAAKWRFKPAIRNGRPVRQAAIFPVHFTLK